MAVEHVDVLIVGAGVSGIGAACHLTRNCPDKSYLVLERRDLAVQRWLRDAEPLLARESIDPGMAAVTPHQSNARLQTAHKI